MASTPDPLARVEPGDAINFSAARQNALSAASRIVLTGQLNQGGGPLKGSLPAGQIYVENLTNADRDVHDCAALDGLVFEPDGSAEDHVPNSVPVFYARQAVEWANFGRFCVFAEPVAAGEIGRAWVGGVFWARVTGEGTHCDLAENAFTLRALPVGHARILWAVGDWAGVAAEGERLAVIQYPAPQLCGLGRALTDIGSGATGTLRVLRGPTRPGVVRNPVFDLADVYNGGPLVNEDAIVEFKWINEHWEIGDGDCPVIE